MARLFLKMKRYGLRVSCLSLGNHGTLEEIGNPNDGLGALVDPADLMCGE